MFTNHVQYHFPQDSPQNRSTVRRLRFRAIPMRGGVLFCSFLILQCFVDLLLHPIGELHASLLGFVYPPGFYAGWGLDDDAVRHLLPAM